MPRNNRQQPKRRNNKRSRLSAPLSLYKQLVESEQIEVGFYHNLIDYQNDARDLFSLMNSGSSDYSQYRDIFTEFKMVEVAFRLVPAYLLTTASSDNAMGLFGARQGIYEASPLTQSVSTVTQYPGTRPLHNYKGRTYNFPIVNGNWFTNTETNTATSRVPKFTYYAAWYKVATTNTAQSIVEIRVRLVAKGKLI